MPVSSDLRSVNFLVPGSTPALADVLLEPGCLWRFWKKELVYWLLISGFF